MTDHMLMAKVSSLLEKEDPFISDLILKTIKEVEEKPISVEAHVKNMERYLDRKMQEVTNK